MKTCWRNEPKSPRAQQPVNWTARSRELWYNPMIAARRSSLQWLFSVASGESDQNAFLIDSGADTSVCQQSLSDSLGGKPSAVGRQMSNNSPRPAAHRSSCAHVTCRANSTCRPTRRACRDQSYQLDRQLREATSSCVTVLVERSSTSILVIESSSNVLVVHVG